MRRHGAGWQRLAIGCAVLVLAAAGCNSISADKGSTTSNTLTIGLESDYAANGYDPALYVSTQRMFFESLYDSLLVQTVDGTVEPGLATKWEYNADNTQLTLTLRDDVTFDDGSRLTAGLVKQNLDRRKPGEFYSSFAKGGDAEITTVAAPDDKTVVITFVKPQPNVHTQLAGQTGMIVGPKGVADPGGLTTTPDGSGPYTLDTTGTAKGDTYHLTAKRDHWRKSAYRYSKLVYKVVMDAQVRANALVAGQLDLAELGNTTVDFVHSRKTGIAKSGGTVMTMPVFDKLGLTSKPFADLRVRQAIQVAIDRQALVANLHKGDMPTSNAFPADAIGHNAELDQTWGFNQTRAKELLTQAGYRDGFQFTMAATSETVADLQLIQAQLAAVGIKMEIKQFTSTTEFYATIRTTPLGFGAIAWYDPLAVVQGQVVGGYMNLQQASDPLINQALEKATTATGSTRQKTLQDLNAALVGQAWLIPVYERFKYFGYQTKEIQKPQPAGIDPYPLLASIKPKA